MVKFSMKYIRSLQNQTIYKSIIKGFLELNLLSSMQQLNAYFILESLMQVVPFNLWLTILQFKVAKRMEKLQRDFLWNGIGGEPKIHLVNWAKVCRPFQVAGWV